MENQRPDLKGKTVKIKPQISELGGQEIDIENYWDELTKKSWMYCDGNPACLHYALRTGTQEFQTPIDNEVLYGHLKNNLGKLVHITEIEGY